VVVFGAVVCVVVRLEVVVTVRAIVCPTAGGAD
jgi:hypothetical protein